MFSWLRRGSKTAAEETGPEARRKRDFSNLAASEARPSMAAAAPPSGQGAAIEAARRRTIVFREIFPPPADPGVSFYGGAPIGPHDMSWPRGPDNLPLTPMMQWDCAALAALDPTGLLPKDGALYLFSSLEWGEDMLFRFLHVPGGGKEWAPLPLPADLPPVFRAEAVSNSILCSSHVPEGEKQDPPRLLPRWPFVPMALDLPAAPASDDGEEGRFWQGGAAFNDALLRVQNPEEAPRRTEPRGNPRLERPFPGFPHDWAAVRVLAADALDHCRDFYIRWETVDPSLSEERRKAQLERWREEALALYREATAEAPGRAIPSAQADMLWQRLSGLAPVFNLRFRGLVQSAVNLSLGLGNAGLATIPPDWIEACDTFHSLATVTFREEYQHEYARRCGLQSDLDQHHEQAKAAGALQTVRDVWAPTPDRMFGAPSFVQGYVEDHVDDWLLLLEISSQEMRGFSLGEGVIQLMIRPGDLAAGRFDRVEAVASSY